MVFRWIRFGFEIGDGIHRRIFTWMMTTMAWWMMTCIAQGGGDHVRTPIHCSYTTDV